MLGHLRTVWSMACIASLDGLITHCCSSGLGVLQNTSNSTIFNLIGRKLAAEITWTWWNILRFAIQFLDMRKPALLTKVREGLTIK